MKTRTLRNFQEVQDFETPVTLTVYTKCPEKWRLVDMETGEVYIGYPTEGKNSWRKTDHSWWPDAGH